MNQTFIIGGGAAGFFAAIHAKQSNPADTVVILEKSSEVLAKFKISGGGRCNVTHACFDPKILCENYPRGRKELLGPFHRFQPRDTMEWFESHGVPLKIEPDNRVFPVSDSSQSIIDCLITTATRMGIKIWTHCQVAHIVKNKDTFCLTLADGQQHLCQKLVLATGSSRKGHEFAQSLGHTLVPPVPSLFTLMIADKALHALSGLSVSTTDVWVAGEKKQMQRGPLLITHWGMSGPAIIKLSAWNARKLHAVNYQTSLHVNWLPHLDEACLKSTLIAAQTKNPKKTVSKQSLLSEIPNRLWAYLTTKANLSPAEFWHQVTGKQMESLCQVLSQGQFPITGKGSFKEEFVTCGGVSLKEIDFKTMQSKCCPGLYLIGELLDIDGVTGGFNFQNAWTTGFLSGASRQS